LCEEIDKQNICNPNRERERERERESVRERLKIKTLGVLCQLGYGHLPLEFYLKKRML
jgi:hypothetical protein